MAFWLEWEIWHVCYSSVKTSFPIYPLSHLATFRRDTGYKHGIANLSALPQHRLLHAHAAQCSHINESRS